MAVIDICSDPNIIVSSGSIGFGFNPEMGLQYPRKLFDEAVSVDDIVVYRKHPSTIIYKGIVRRISRSMSSENIDISCSAAETVLEAKTWVPTYTAYNKDILCRNSLLNATVADVIAAEYTNNVTGPQNWFTAVECPSSVASLIATPTDTHQSSFLTVMQGIIASYPHVQWFIEYDAAALTVLPIGKLVFVDTKLGRNTHTLTVGEDLHELDLSEDASNCAGTLNVYGGGDFVEVDEILTPAWDTDDESIPETVTVTAPLANDFDEQLVTYLAWGYDLTSEPVIKVVLGGSLTTLAGGKEYWFDPARGGILWNQLDGSLDSGGNLVSGPPPVGGRRIAARHPDFFGANLEISYNYCGPDCYRLYSVSEPIANLRLRLSRVPDPSNPGNSMDVATEQSTVIEAFRPVPITDLTDPHYQTVAGYGVSKVLIPDETDITWDERNPNYGSAKGFGVPLGSPEFEDGRQCVRFEQRQLVFSPPFIWYELSQPPPPMNWRTWQIKLRYTAWRNLLETRVGTVGNAYIGRFVFESMRRYQTSVSASQCVLRLGLTGGSVSSVTIVQGGIGYATTPTVRVAGDGTGATVVLTLNGSGTVVTAAVGLPGSGYTQATALVASSSGIIVNDTARLAVLADEVRDYYGSPSWEGSAALSCAMLVNGAYKLTQVAVGIGDKVTLDGNIEADIATRFIGIVNQIDIASLELGQAGVTFGPRMPQRNPFEPKPPVFVDVERNGNLVLDIYATQRRST